MDPSNEGKERKRERKWKTQNRNNKIIHHKNKTKQRKQKERKKIGNGKEAKRCKNIQYRPDNSHPNSIKMDDSEEVDIYVAKCTFRNERKKEKKAHFNKVIGENKTIIS